MHAAPTSLYALCLLACLSAPVQAETPIITAMDNRIPITVSPEERNQVLYEMRDFLHNLFNIQTAMARGDMTGAGKAAKSMGHVLHRFPPSLQDRLPVAFMEMSHGMHEIFEVMARDAQGKADVGHAMGQMAEALTYCSGCHDTYRFQVVESKPAPRKR